MALRDRAKMTISSIATGGVGGVEAGKGTLTLGSAVTNYQTFAAANVADAEVVTYCIEETGGLWELGTGTYTSSGTTLSRSSVIASSSGTSLVAFTTAATVYVTASAADLTPTFLTLTDTPSSYSGQGSKIVRVNSGATALEFATVGTGSGQIAAGDHTHSGYQTEDAQLTALAGITWTSGTQVPVFTAATTVSLLTVGQGAGNLIDKDSGDALYQAKDTTLTNFAGLTIAADKGVYGTGSDTFATYDLTAGGRAWGNLTGAANTIPYFSGPNTITEISINTEGRGLLNSTAGTTFVKPGTLTVGTIKAAASLTTDASINIPPGTAPSSPNSGDVWNASGVLYYRNNAAATETIASYTGSALPATKGGTGFGTYATGDLLYSDATNSLAKLAGNTTADRKFLSQIGNGSASAAPTWEQTIGVANGGTGVNTLTGLVKGNGTSAFSAASAGTDFVKAGTLTVGGGILAAASASGYPSLNIPSGTAPSSPASGDIWNVSGTLYYRDAASTTRIIRSTGKETVWVPASAMVSRTTNGATAATTESSTNKIMQKTLNFDQTTAQYAQFTVAMPKDWDLGSVTFIPYWTASAGSVSQTCIFSLAGVAVSDDEVLDAAFGTAVTSSDALLATGDVHIGPESSAITIAGTLSAGDIVFFQVARDISDTLAGDAKLLGIKLLYTTNAANDS